MVIIMKILSLLIVTLFFSSCAMLNGGGVQQAAQNELISYTDRLVPNPQAEEVLEVAFSTSRIPWKKEDLEFIDKSRKSIEAMGDFLKFRLQLDSTIPYYTYKVAFEFIQNQYNILQHILDKRVAIEGAVSTKDQIIYYYVKRDIVERLYTQQMKIAATEKSINDKASKNTVEEMKAIFKAIKPLIDIAI